MNTFFRLRKAALFVVAGLAAVFMVAGCKGDDGDETGGGNNASAASLTSVSIKGPSDIAADGAGTLTATAGYTGEIASYITYKWEIATGKDSAEIVGTGSKATIKGTNTTEQSKSVTVKVTAAYDGTTKTATHTVTIAAKGASVENEITGLELVPPTSSVACDGQVTLTPKVTYTGNLTESDFTVTWEITEGSDYAELVVPSAKARGELTFTGGNTRILQAKNGTNSKQTVIVSVTVSAGGKSLTKECTVTVGAASTTENRTWIWNPSRATTVAAVSSDTDSKDSEHNTSVTLISGAAISESSLTDSEGATYSNALYFNGGGSKAFKAVKFAVDGACKISVVARSSGDSERSLILSDGSNELATFPAVLKSATPAPQSYDYTGGSGTLYLYSKSGGINVYLIQAVYGSSSSSSVTTVTISGNQSVVVGNSVTLTATPNATATGAYTWQVTAGSDYVTLGTNTTNTIMVTGKAAGTAKITATVDGVPSAPYTVTVREAGATGNVISLTDTPTGYAGYGYTTSPYYTGDKTITIDASSATAANDLKTYAKKGNYVIYIKGMIDMTYNSTYGGSMLPSSWNDDNAALGKFIAAQYNSATMTDNVSKIESWSAWRQAYGAFCTQTGNNSDYSSDTAKNASTIDRYQYALVQAWKAQIQIPLASNTTIIGLDDNSGIKGGSISISDVNNIMLRNLHLQDAFDPFPHHETSSGKTDGWNAEYDCVTIQGKNSYIWIDHCTFEDTISVGWTNFAGVKTGYNVPAQAYSTSNSDYEMWQTYDGLCDIKGKTTNVTVSYCVFKNHDKTMLLGSDDNEKYDSVVLDHTAKTITLHHNYFDGCVQRLPFVRTANIHIYNNYFSHDNTNGYDQKASIQIRAKAWVISEQNNFGQGISYRYKGDSATESKGYLSDTKLYDADNNVGVSKTATEKWTSVTTKPFETGYSPEYDNANDLPILLPANAGAGVWTVQQ